MLIVRLICKKKKYYIQNLIYVIFKKNTKKNTDAKKLNDIRLYTDFMQKNFEKRKTGIICTFC